MKLHPDGTVEGTPDELASYAYHRDILDRLVYGDNPEAKKESIWGKGYIDGVLHKQHVKKVLEE
ncbi:hypothetical protein MKY64_30450 [Paenibacillus sp. FSL R7-0210]|uniref:hypothetical protein n=1 Tax=Paenibacillus sp. FSL R7-0210 TaxID=2921676 RepID=UPI0030FBEFEC